jgi:F-type H+-transporting ATPase subunit epsilon
MATASGKTLKVVIVTPEKAVLDATADLVVLPLYDGEAGVQPGHSAFVAQLGPGELRINTGGNVQRFFVDGGFAQVAKDLVNVLTPKAAAAGELTAAVLTAATAAAETLPATNLIEQATKQRAEARAKAMARVAAKA